MINDSQFTAGEQFTFDEGIHVLGSGEIIKVIGEFPSF